MPVPPVRRIFNESFARGGRLYCHGPSHQNMPKTDRRRLEFVIDGVAHPVEEIDYSTLHVTMAYAEAGVPAPAGDLYAVEGFDRECVKAAVNTLFAITRSIEFVSVSRKDSPSVRIFLTPKRSTAQFA